MKTVVLLSGGLDSSVLLAWVRNRTPATSVFAVSVDYGQRHRRELLAAASVAELYRAPHEVIELPVSLMSGSSLTGGGDVPDGHYADPSMRSTVVPARNTLLLAVAAAVAVREKCHEIAYAAHAGDHAIYPDCRPEFISAFGGVLATCDYEPIQLLTPFSNIDKTQIVRIGHSLAVPFARTWSCYKGGERHCGKCGTCVERIEAFKLAGIGDPTEYEVTL